MTNNAQIYLDALVALEFIRWKHKGAESEEEEKHLDLLDVLWRQLSNDERQVVDGEPLDAATLNHPSWKGASVTLTLDVDVQRHDRKASLERRGIL